MRMEGDGGSGEGGTVGGETGRVGGNRIGSKPHGRLAALRCAMLHASEGSAVSPTRGAPLPLAVGSLEFCHTGRAGAIWTGGTGSGAAASEL